MKNYSERLGDMVVTQLDIGGFNELTENQKKLAYYLGEAGLWGRFISVDQGNKHNIPLFKGLIDLYHAVDVSPTLKVQLHDTLYTMFVHNGVYDSTTGEKLNLPLNKDSLDGARVLYPDLVKVIEDNWFNAEIKQWRTVQKAGEGIDAVATSGGNFYDGLTKDEVIAFREKQSVALIAENEKASIAPVGFNQRLFKDENGVVQAQTISENGLYGVYVKKIIENLKHALEFSENETQHNSIESLIKFYQTGDAVDFDNHCVHWTQDKESAIYFINGLIESYDDPLTVGCTFESIVAFRNMEQTAKVGKIVENIQWFENQMPFAPEFKKEKAVGLSAHYVRVISSAGETAPTLPLGINLPNSDWIREVHGSKSVNLENSASARSGFEGELRRAMYLPEYVGLIETHGVMVNNLHTDLHEIAGHGSGRVLEGANPDDLGVFYSTIEEARADLVALYFIGNPKLKEIGIYDKDTDLNEVATAMYVSYLTNGAFAQLRRINGEELTQAHFRNRQLIANWVLEHADKDKIYMVENDGHAFIKVVDNEHMRQLCGKLLTEVQEMKSTGNYVKAEDLVMGYGTKVNQKLLKDVHERVSGLNLPRTVAFINPVMSFDSNGDVKMSQPADFFRQQCDLFMKTCTLDSQNKLRIK